MQLSTPQTIEALLASIGAPVRGSRHRNPVVVNQKPVRAHKSSRCLCGCTCRMCTDLGITPASRGDEMGTLVTYLLEITIIIREYDGVPFGPFRRIHGDEMGTPGGDEMGTPS